MFRFCSCGRFLGVKEPVKDKSVTTGVCRDCLDRFKAEADKFWKAVEKAESKVGRKRPCGKEAKHDPDELMMQERN